jgi:hypothetical protein
VLLDQLGDVGLVTPPYQMLSGTTSRGGAGQAALYAAGGDHLDVGQPPPPLLLAQGDGFLGRVDGQPRGWAEGYQPLDVQGDGCRGIKTT